jgi:phage shock protein C
MENPDRQPFNIHDRLRREGLTRSRDGALLGGVCSGLGRRIGLDPWPSRVLFGAALLAIPGSQVILYPVLWALLPEAEHTKTATAAPATPAA